MNRLFSVAVSVGVLCARPPVSGLAATAHTGQVVMGTVLQVTVVADDAARAREMTARAVKIARHWDDVLTTWRPEGELARLNAAAGEGPQRISADLTFALATMTRLSGLTGGAFDPGVGPIVATYSRPEGTLPESRVGTRIREVLTLGDGIAALSTGAALDAGGIGKGIALDAIAMELRAAGATAVYLDFGGSSQLAFGTMESGDPWTLALAGLEPGVSHGLMRLQGALSTSRSRPVGDETGPIVDPHTGRAVTDPRFATCYAATATQAEACSKAFIVMGWTAYESNRGAGWGALYEDSDELHFSPGFASMISGGRVAHASTYDSTAPKKMKK
jgi:thiamine biosynthesis lipoprotein